MNSPPAPASFPYGSRRDRSVVDYERLLSALEQLPDVVASQDRHREEPTPPLRTDRPA